MPQSKEVTSNVYVSQRRIMAAKVYVFELLKTSFKFCFSRARALNKVIFVLFLLTAPWSARNNGKIVDQEDFFIFCETLQKYQFILKL